MPGKPRQQEDPGFFSGSRGPMTTQELQPPGQATKLSFKDKAGTSLPMAADVTGQSLCADGGSTVSRALIPGRLWGPGADTPTGVSFRDYQTGTGTLGRRPHSQ